MSIKLIPGKLYRYNFPRPEGFPQTLVCSPESGHKKTKEDSVTISNKGILHFLYDRKIWLNNKDEDKECIF